MSLSSRERTVAYPHRVMNKVSVFLAPKDVVDNRYQSVVSIDDETVLTINSQSNFNAKDGRIFDYVLSRIQAIGLDNNSIELDTIDVLDELRIQERTENRASVINSYENLLDVQITLSWNGGAINFGLIESVEDIDGNFTKNLTLCQSFINALDESAAKRRYINIYRTMRAKSIYSIELAKLLQMDGGGVDTKGKPKSVKKIDHQRVCKYLCLDENSPSSKSMIRKSLNELAKLGYPSYSFNGRVNKWEIQN